MDMHAAEVQWRERDLRRCGLRSTFRGNDAPTFWCPVARYPIEPRAEGGVEVSFWHGKWAPLYSESVVVSHLIYT